MIRKQYPGIDEKRVCQTGFLDGMTQRMPDLRHGGKDRVGGLDEPVQAAESGQVGGGR